MQSTYFIAVVAAFAGFAAAAEQLRDGSAVEVAKVAGQAMMDSMGVPLPVAYTTTKTVSITTAATTAYATITEKHNLPFSYAAQPSPSPASVDFDLGEKDITVKVTPETGSGAPFNVTFDLTDEKKPTCKGECTSCCSSGQRKSTCPCGETCQCKPTCQCKHGGLIKRSEDGAVEVVEECEDCLIKFDHLRQDPVTNFGNSVPTSTEAEFLKETFTEDVLAQLDDAEDFISDPTLRKPVMPSPIDLKNLSSLANSSARLDGLGKNSSSKSKELDMEIGAATLSSSAVMKMIPSVCTLMMTVLVAFGY